MNIWTYWPHNKGIHRFSPSVQFLRTVLVEEVFKDEVDHHTHRLSQHHEQSLTRDVRQQTKWWPELNLDIVMFEVGPFSILVTWGHRYLQPKSGSFSFLFSPGYYYVAEMVFRAPVTTMITIIIMTVFSIFKKSLISPAK